MGRPAHHRFGHGRPREAFGAPVQSRRGVVLTPRISVAPTRPRRARKSTDEGAAKAIQDPEVVEHRAAAA